MANDTDANATTMTETIENDRIHIRITELEPWPVLIFGQFCLYKEDLARFGRVEFHGGQRGDDDH